jgi:uncharacterized cupredoxin-like copper-binding protein
MKRILMAAAVLAVVVAACGGNGKTSEAVPSRTIDIDMVDIAFQPKAIQVERGATVRFVFHNRGKTAHDAFIGDAKAQADHEQEMREAGGAHGMHHGKAKGITVKPGQTGRLIHSFDEAGTVEIGCHQPGHYATGMKLPVTIA